MEDMEEMLVTEEAAPVETEETAEDAVAEGTEEAEESAESVEETEPTADTAETAEVSDEAPAEPTVPVRYPVTYGDDTREMTVEELTDYAGRGMQYDEIAPTWNNLCRMASERGETPEQLIDAIAAAEERVIYERLLREANGNRSIADRLMELEKNRRSMAAASAEQAKREAAQTAKQEETDRMAAEFLELKAEFPELAEFKDVPQAVVQTAVKSKLHLMDAYLRYQHAEGKKIAKNDQTKAAASASAMGSLSDTPPEPSAVDPYIQAMMDGIHAAL